MKQIKNNSQSHGMQDFEIKLHHACSNRDTRTCLELLNNNSTELDTKVINRNQTLILAVKNENVKIVSELLKLNLDVNIQNSEGATALHIASKIGNLTIVNLLLKNQANINVKDSKYGESALHKAIWNGQIEIMEKLLLSGADCNIQDDDIGWTPLHVAVYMNNLKVVQKFLQIVNDLNIRLDVKTLDEKQILHLAWQWKKKISRSSRRL